MVGVPGDTRKFWTGKTPASHGPSWEDARFRFPLSMPEIALLCFEAHEEYKTGLEEYFVGQAVIPVWELMLGYRVVQLKTKKGEVKRHGPRLLCKFEMTDAGDKLSA